MSLRLFHVTEFAQSMLSPADQREARHPAQLLLLASLWLALAGNLPLWRELARLPMDFGSLLWIGLCFGLLTTAALGVLLSLLNWSWLLKISVMPLLANSAIRRSTSRLAAGSRLDVGSSSSRISGSSRSILPKITLVFSPPLN